jgi:phenylalanyl-tRNA synthetase alpha chain
MGHLHPLTQTIRDIELIFRQMGYTVAAGPEVETEHYNFDALNTPSDHPARDMQDTFWLKQKSPDGERMLLRTQTSAVQIRFMESHIKNGGEPPFRIVVPGGRIFRNEATDVSHEANFYQQEALYVDRNVTMADLKGTLAEFCRKFFKDEGVRIRFRPSYFPFVEPALEVDMYWAERDRWLEIAGSGLVHPNVLEAVGIDPHLWNGFAFSFGVDRLMMLRHGVPDVRLSYGGDLRFVNQF